MTLGDLIKEYRIENKISMAEFASLSGMSKAYISLLEKNKNPKTGKEITPSIDIIKKVSDVIGIDFDDVFNSIDSTTKIVVGIKKTNNTIEKESLPSNILPLPKTKKVPLLGSIACGEPILAVENIEDYIDMDNEIHADFALKCKGDSMINARIFNGDIVYIRKQEHVENGEIAAVLIHGMESEAEATLKRFYNEGDKIRLCAENPLYPDQIFREEGMNSIHVLGKAVAFLSAVK